MSIGFVQASTLGNFSGVATSGTKTVSLTGTSAGNALFLLTSWLDNNDVGSGLSNISDGTNTWNNPTTKGDSHATRAVNNQPTAAIYSAYNIAGGNVTLTMTNTATGGANSYWKCILVEFSAVLASAANDATGNGSANNGNTGPITCTGGTLSTTGELGLVAYAADAAESGLAVPSGWTGLSGPAGSFPSYGFAYYIASATTALSPSWGSNGSSFNWANALAAYKPAVAGTTTHFLATMGCGQ